MKALLTAHCWLMLLSAGTLFAQDSLLVIDSFDPIVAWEARPSNGVTERLSGDRGEMGTALRVDLTSRLATVWAVVPPDADQR